MVNKNLADVEKNIEPEVVPTHDECASDEPNGFLPKRTRPPLLASTNRAVV